METDSKMTCMLVLADKNFKAAIVIMLKDIRKNMIIINEHVWNLSSKKETLKKNQILGLENTVSEIFKKSFDGSNSRLEMMKKRSVNLKTKE